jgi:hypothetical protein
MQETRAASEVSTSENILIRTRANAPANDDLLHGRVRRCRSCGTETRSGAGICAPCMDAMQTDLVQGARDDIASPRIRVIELPVAYIPSPRRWKGKVINQAEIDAFNERYAGCLIKPVYRHRGRC